MSFFAQNISSSCWSRWINLSRTTRDCSFCWSTPSATRTTRSEDNPREDFPAFVGATLDPAPSPSSSRCTECIPEPTADGEPELTAGDEPLPHRATEQRIAVEPKLNMTSVQVCEPATNPDASVIVERSSTHCNMAEGELVVDLGLFEAERGFDWGIFADLPPLLPPSSELTETATPELSPEEAYRCPPSHQLMAHPPPLWPGSPLAPPGSLVNPAPPWAVFNHPTPRDSTPPASPHPSVKLLHPSGSTLVFCLSDSTAASRIHASASVTGVISSTSTLRILPVPPFLRLCQAPPSLRLHLGLL
ncbi:hypothetical protein M9458_014641, partial [Cirrhinus mrigala]